MPEQIDLFPELAPKYCLDTNVVSSFLKLTPEETYGKDVFASAWGFIEEKIASGQMIMPKVVADELKKWGNPEVDAWVQTYAHAFVNIDDAQLTSMRSIVNRFPTYASATGYSNDLHIVGLSKARNLTVVTLEKRQTQISVTKSPKIPNVCDDQGMVCLSVVEFFREEGVNF